MTQRTVRRAGGVGRRTRRVRRSSAGLTPVRAGAALTMLICAGAIYGLTATSAFGYDPAHLKIEGASVVPDDVIRERLGLADGQNLVDVATDPLEARLAGIPALARAEVSIGLPDTVGVKVEERQPVLVWRIGDRAFLADRNGMLFAEVDEAQTSAAGLPVIRDEREASRGFAVSAALNPVDLDVATRLASLTPVQAGSTASALAVGVTDRYGFVLRTVPDSWTAAFGFYGLSQRTPELIPGQVLVLQKLLAQVGESTVETVILGDDREGTYIPKATPRPSATPKP
jgi:cell division septal protein FtsQ